MTEMPNNNSKLLIDTSRVRNLFKQIKDKNIDTKVYLQRKNIGLFEYLLESDDVIDIIHYYRVEQGVTQLEMANLANIDGETYRAYEIKRIPLINYDYIQIFIKRLGIEDKVHIPEFNLFIRDYPLTKIIDILLQEKINKREFCRQSKISHSALDHWIAKKGDVKLDSNIYRKLYLYWKEYRNYNCEREM